MHHSKAILVLLLLLAVSIFALYEEEVGRNDWYKEFLGAPLHLVQLPHQNDATQQHLNRLFFVATSKNVIAAINVRSGEIAWRRVLTESIQAMKQTGQDQLMTLSADCTNVRTWDLQGFPLWNEVISEKTSSHCQIKSHNQYAAILTEHFVTFRNIETGSTLWIYPAESTTPFAILDGKQGTTLVVATLDIIDKVIMTVNFVTLDVVSGQVKDKKSINLKTPVGIQNMKDAFATSDGTLVLLDRVDNHIVLVSQENQQVISSEDSLQHVEFLNTDSVILRDTQSNTLTEVDTKQFVLQRLSEVFASKQVRVTIANKQIKFVTDKDEQAMEWNVEERGYPVHVLVQPFVGQQSGIRYIIVAQDASVTVMQSGKALWTREEALAHIQSTQFVDLPAKLSVSHQDRDLLSLSTRITYQIQQIKNLVQSLMEKKEQTSTSSTAKNNATFRDKYAFDKYIIAATSVGKVFALRTSDGSIAWSLFYPQFVNKNVALPASFKLYRLTKSAEEPTLLAIVASTSQATHVATVNSISAQVSNIETLDKTVQSVLIPADEHQPLVFFDEELKAYIYQDVKNVLKSFGKTIHFYLSVHGQISGYQWNVQQEQASLAWNIHFTNEIVAIDKHDNSPYYSVVHVTGAGDVLHKYINPHLLGVATLSKATESNPKRLLDIYLIDTVTGETVYRTQLDNVEGPVAMHLDDNIVVCHLLKQKEKRYELIALELYQNDTSIERSVVGALLGANSRDATFSSYKLPKPFVIKQAFVFPTGVTAISTSRTKLGITSKSFLFGLTSNQVLSMPKKLLDVRRPTGAPSAGDQEEGLLPYHPVLPLEGTAIISYNRSIHQITQIDTADSQLESTSHILAHGVDLFYTRVTPALSYDMLNEDFSYKLLLVTVVTLLAVTLLARRWAHNKEVARAWQ